ncbi:MAG: hypothetical protein QOG53_1275 [Frankiales bacterium]|nr:hypothetical protein [Frankiales bacterium]
MCRREESHLAARPSAPYESRQFIAEQCDRLDMPELADTAKLLTSELVTNVVVHTGADPVVAVAVTCGQLVVEVRDEARDLPKDPGDPQAETGESAGGRGLTLVAALAEDWGVRQVPDDGKAIWFALRPDNPPAYAETCDCCDPLCEAVAAQ